MKFLGSIVSGDAPTLAEVRAAVKKLKNGRAAGNDGIPPEFLKCALEPVSTALHRLFLLVWKTGKVPSDWRDGIIRKRSVATIVQ